MTHELLLAALLESIPLQKIEFSNTSTAALSSMPIAYRFFPNSPIYFTKPVNVYFNQTINAWVFTTQRTGIVLVIELPANKPHFRTIF